MDAKTKKTLVDAAVQQLADALTHGEAGTAHSYALTLGLVDALPVEAAGMDTHPVMPPEGHAGVVTEVRKVLEHTGAGLLRALDVFTATVGAYAPGSHREAVILEVGDAAFRAFKRALDERYKSRLQEPPSRWPYGITVHTPSGRVVIRNQEGG